MNWRDMCSRASLFAKRIRTAIAKPFDPAILVGDKSRARRDDEPDPEDEVLAEKSRQLDELYRTYPPEDERPEGKKHLSWRDKLWTHIRPLLVLNGTLFALFLIGASILPPSHPLPSIAIMCSAATFAYWFWVGRWHKRIMDRVWEKFTEKYGKHWHRR